MTFLNPLLAAGAIAFLVPLVIHFLNRSRFRTVNWGAMHLLESVITVNHRRLHLEQILLLLVRCAIPVLLALALARPVLTGMQSAAGDSPVSLVILLDTSYSMGTVTGDGAVFAKAVQSAIDIISEAGTGSEFSVILTGGRATPLFDQPVHDSAALIRRLKTVVPEFGATDVSDALNSGLTMLSGMHNARRELVVISDFQSTDWNQITESEFTTFISQREAQTVLPGVTFLPLNSTAGANLSVGEISLPQRALGIGQTFHVRAAIRAGATSGERNVRVSLNVDGQQHSVSEVAVADRGETQVLFTCQVDSPGSHILEVQLQGTDALPFDNRAMAAVQIQERVPVLLVDGDPSKQALKSETDFLSIALTPYTFSRMSLADLIETATIQSRELTEALSPDVRVVCLANVSRLDDKAVDSLTEFVRSGGALIVFPGNRIDVDWYNQRLYSDGRGLLPGQLNEIQDRSKETDVPGRIVSQRFEHPALQLFNEPSNGNLSSAEIRQWFRVSTSPGQKSMTAASLNNGDPLLVQHEFGSGVVLLSAIPCDSDWSNLPMQPVFVPLMQQIVTTLASQALPPTNIRAGEPLLAAFPTEETDLPVALKLPDGRQTTVYTSSSGRFQTARYDATEHLGVYSLTAPDASVTHYVADTTRTESDLRFLNEEEIQSVVENCRAVTVHSAADYIEQDRLKRHGREIWKPVLAALLALMFLELILQQRFAKVRT